MTSSVRAVTLDVTGTLIYCPQVADIYAEVLSRHGMPIDTEATADLIGVVWQEMTCLTQPGVERFGAHPGGARGWWARSSGAKPTW